MIEGLEVVTLEGGEGGEGDAEKLPLIFLHEGLGSVSQWRDFPRALVAASGRRAIVYSRAGYGHSRAIVRPRPLSFMHDEARSVLPALLDDLAIERATLIGHSDGASIALVFAAEHPARVDRLILEAPHVFVEDVCVASIAKVRAEWGHTELRARLSRHHRDVDSAFLGWADAWLDPAFRAWNLESFLPNVIAPTLLIQGEDDEYGTLAQVEAIAAQVKGPVERLILPRCGHAPHRDRPDEVLAAMRAFLERGCAPVSARERR